MPLATTDPGYYEEFLAIMGYPPWGPGVGPVGVDLSTADVVIQTEEEPMSWIEDIYTAVDANVFGGELPGGSPVGTSLTPFVPSTTSVPAVIPTTGTTITASSAASQLKTYCYKYVDGQWKLVKMRRKRRRKLVTKSDIAGLAQLKGVIGMGKAFETWIATHS